MIDLKAAFRVVSDNNSLAHFRGPCDAALIAAAERAFGGSFPPIYHQFLRELGGGSFASLDVYGIVHADFKNSGHPDGVWITLKARMRASLPAGLYIVSELGNGEVHCIELQERDGPVISYEPGFPEEEQLREVLATDFGEFFLHSVREALAIESQGPPPHL